MTSQSVSIRENADGIVFELASGAELAGHIVILATGHDSRKLLAACYANPRVPPVRRKDQKRRLGFDPRVGLTMVDYVLSPLRDGHTGPILSILRPKRLLSTRIPLLAYLLQVSDEVAARRSVEHAHWHACAGHKFLRVSQPLVETVPGPGESGAP